jgi:hypothetical protein
MIRKERVLQDYGCRICVVPAETGDCVYSAFDKGEQAEIFPPVQLNYFDNIIFFI